MRDARADRSAAVGEMDVLADVTLSVRSASPVCSPIRIRIRPGSSAIFPQPQQRLLAPRIGQHIEERIALSVHLDTALGREDFAKHWPMLCQRLRVRLRPGGALAAAASTPRRP